MRYNNFAYRSLRTNFAINPTADIRPAKAPSVFFYDRRSLAHECTEANGEQGNGNSNGNVNSNRNGNRRTQMN